MKTKLFKELLKYLSDEEKDKLIIILCSDYLKDEEQFQQESPVFDYR